MEEDSWGFRGRNEQVTRETSKSCRGKRGKVKVKWGVNSGYEGNGTKLCQFVSWND